MIGLVIVCRTVVRSHIKAAVIVSHALQPLGRHLHMDLAEIGARLQIIPVEVPAALFTDPGTHPHRFCIRVHRDPGALQLSAFRLKGEGAFELQRIAVIDRDLNVFPDTVHKILSADVQFILIYIDIRDVIDFQVIALEGVVVYENQIPVFIILCQGGGTAYPVIPVLGTNALPSCDLHRAVQCIRMRRHHNGRVLFRPLCGFLQCKSLTGQGCQDHD